MILEADYWEKIKCSVLKFMLKIHIIKLIIRKVLAYLFYSNFSTDDEIGKAFAILIIYLPQMTKKVMGNVIS